MGITSVSKKYRNFTLAAAVNSGRRDLLTAADIEEILIRGMIASEQEMNDQEGALNGLLTAYDRLLSSEALEREDANPPETLNGPAAERRMMDAYIAGYKAQSNLDVSEDVNQGNSGWNWPTCLKYERELEIYPARLCDRYGFELGYQHSIDATMMARIYLEEHPQ